MAEAIKQVMKITKTIQVEEETIVLKLSPDEAQFIADCMGRIIGGEKTRARFHAPIHRALSEVGFQSNAYDIHKKGDITFTS